MQWYYATGGQQKGPLNETEFDEAVRNGTIKPDTLVWRQGLANWQAYSAVGGTSAAPEGTSGDDTEVCAMSGKRYPKREMLQYEGKWISAEHRDAYFQRMREGVSLPGTFVYGGFWRRFLAKFLDGLILGTVGVGINVLCAVIMFGTGNYVTGIENVGPASFIVYQLVTTGIGIVLGIAYAVFFIRRYSATPGKMALGLKLVRPDGSPLSVGRIIGRHFAEWINAFTLLIGYIIAAFDDEKRALHDRICDTRVIKVR